MRKISFCALSQKEVISCCGGKRIGTVCDIEIDCECGRVLSIIVKENTRHFEFSGRSKSLIIPWERIDTIGEDFIIVNGDFGCDICEDKKEQKKSLWSSLTE